MNPEKSQGYEFCLFRIPYNGGRVIWEITNRCNYSCTYCIFSSEKTNNLNELNTKEIICALEELSENNFKSIKFTGGEPFIRKDFMHILRKSKELGIINDVSTNASLINKTVASELSELVEMVHVSIDGPNKEIHEIVRGKGTYKPTIRGLKHLAQSNYVRVGTVIFKGNESYLEQIVQSILPFGAKEIIFSFMEPVGRLKKDSSLISTRTIENVKSEIENLASIYPKIKINYSFTEHSSKYRGICPGATRFLYINNLGKISPCTWVSAMHPEYQTSQTLKETTFKNLINSPEIQSYFNYIQCQINEEKIGCPMRIRK